MKTHKKMKSYSPYLDYKNILIMTNNGHDFTFYDSDEFAVRKEESRQGSYDKLEPDLITTLSLYLHGNFWGLVDNHVIYIKDERIAFLIVGVDDFYINIENLQLFGYLKTALERYLRKYS